MVVHGQAMKAMCLVRISFVFFSPVLLTSVELPAFVQGRNLTDVVYVLSGVYGRLPCRTEAVRKRAHGVSAEPALEFQPPYPSHHPALLCRVCLSHAAQGSYRWHGRALCIEASS